MVTKTMSSNEAKQNWGSVMAAASEPDGAVIVESHGKPRVAVIPFEALQELQNFRRAEQREESLQRLRALERRIGNRNSDLSEAQIEEFSIRAGKEIKRAAAARQRELARKSSGE